LIGAGASLAACGGDDTNGGTPDGGTDGGTDVTTDRGAPDTSVTDTSVTDAPEDAADAACVAPKTTCSGACVDTSTDTSNCGACGHACATGAACKSGHCDNDIATVAAGEEIACAVKFDGTVWCWGSNQMGALGTAPSASDLSCGQEHCNKVPQKVLAGAAMVDTGWQFACATKTDGSVWCWGRNTFGQIGHAPGTGGDVICDDANVFVQDPGESQIALADGGTTGVYCNPTPSQVALPGGAKAAAVSTGYLVACARTVGTTSDAGVVAGDVYCWGSNSYDGVGAYSDAGAAVPTPTKVSGFNGDVVDLQVAIGSRDACALKQDGTVWCWGDNRFGRTGAVAGSGDDCPLGVCSPIPVQVKVQAASDAGADAGDIGLGAPLTDVIHVRAGAASGCALKTDGTVWCWGYDGYATLADNGPYDSSQHPGARKIPALPSSIKGIAQHLNAVFATDGTGAVWGWGDNTFGQLGNGTLTSAPCPVVLFDGGACVSPPVTLTGLNAFRTLAAGAWFGVGVKQDGSVLAWGRNTHAQLGHLPGTSNDTTCTGPAQQGFTPDTASCNPTPTAVTFP
jgi:alpha-tubulin suppressor-like RCC1 family protein